MVFDARLVGFEPTTHGFEDRYSDPLSYRRMPENEAKTALLGLIR